MKPNTEAKLHDETMTSHQSSFLSSQQPPQPVHQDDADEEDENVKQLGDCSSLYLSLQDCLIKTDRNWKSCQKEVQALKACNEKKRGK
ncbi:hypothetical protein BVRB_3g063210 [Beta vulgaris subsp. vulgaris]|uniref:uncharacterized protein LOC104889515 n=1 Tax=Beta vulgaris subsp. vulgaris TaxID=3555 RepID=UPI00053FC565|nr:uncharacterized protein LOC104889515 [Beta vulgaris subsp. vulgaris]XP_010673056.1 uncharacterized protein LOC104889515 [Beta vulgaris subsp. vulgaris]XP_019103801.1 uncharacterized protein LOC104889515 [Beta vulgaris subsp. vulgaris]KMT15210.1 hypothetical protein BVRB_3g063210 [Beta vulgaris subsp. vulgaris]